MKMSKTKGRGAQAVDRIEFKFLVALSFAICLIAVSVARLFSSAEPAEASIFAEAKSAAFAAVGYAFHA